MIHTVGVAADVVLVLTDTNGCLCLCCQVLFSYVVSNIVVV
jgi:hypothetical protein